MSRQIKVKAEGPPPSLSEFIEKLENIYTVVKTSRLIEHHEDDHAHIYLTLLEERYK